MSALGYVNTNWLDTDVAYVPTITESQNAALNNITIYPNVPSNSWYTTYYPWGYETKTKIRLKLSEVERLRLAAKDDAKLKTILQKFAPHIEIEVDFG